MQVLSLIYRQLQGEQLPVGLMRIFEEGNAIHEKWQRLFIRAGYSKAEEQILMKAWDRKQEGSDRHQFSFDFCPKLLPDFCSFH